MEKPKEKHPELFEITTPGKYRLVKEQSLPGAIKENVPPIPVPEQITISFLLKYYRFIIKGLTRKELAQQAGIYPNQVSDIENNKIKPQRRTIQKLARVLGDDFLRLTYRG